MNRAVLTLLGLGAAAVLAIFIGKQFLGSAEDAKDRREDDLTGLTLPRLESINVLEDSELPQGIEPPGVGDSFMYIEVDILYPSAAREPDGDPYGLAGINGRSDTTAPVSKQTEETDDGIYVALVFRVSDAFEHAALVRGERKLLERIEAP
jgi:hypothetical protein